MADLHFIIVNSKPRPSRIHMSRLYRRVDFKVFQETEEIPIFKIMGGKKDDVFIYDRCGRLAYHIPHPLSKMSNEGGLVPFSILTTYYRSPCGYCEKITNATVTDYDVVEDNRDGINSSKEDNDNEDAEQASYPTSERPEENLLNEELINSTLHNRELNLDSIENNIEINENKTAEPNNIFYRLYSYFFNSKSTAQTPLSGNLTVVTTENSENIDNNVDINDTNDVAFNNSKSNETDFTKDLFMTDSTDSVTNNTSSPEELDKCYEVDTNVCKRYSKISLNTIERCCSGAIRLTSRSFCTKTRRRRYCKKLQPVLKCCLGMLRNAATSKASPALPVTPETKHVTAICCLTPKPDARMCRVVHFDACESYEYTIPETEVTSEIHVETQGQIDGSP